MFPAIPYCIDLIGGPYLVTDPQARERLPTKEVMVPSRPPPIPRRWSHSWRATSDGAVSAATDPASVEPQLACYE